VALPVSSLQSDPISVPRKKVFLAEDAADVRASLSALLDLHGFDVIGMAGSEFAATQWLADHGAGWDLAIIDLVLQDGSGFHVLQRFAKARTGGKVVVFSGFVTDAIRQRCKELGADAVFLKTDIPRLIDFLSSFA